MNKLLVVSISLLTFHQALGAPAPQQFQTHAYQTHSIYPSYNVHHQTIPISIFPHSALSPHPVGLNSVPLNANEQKKLESNYREILEKFKSENSHPKADGPTNVSPAVNSPLVSGKILSNVVHSKGPVGGLELTSLEHHHADPIFGPEIGSKYDIHYAPEHLISLPAFSEYAAYPVHAAFPPQSVFPSAYTDFSSYPEYPHFGGSNPFLSAAAVGSPPRDPNVAIDPLPKGDSNPFLNVADVGTPPRDPNVAIDSSPKEGSSNGEIANRPETSNESNDSTTEANIGAPPSIDGPKPEKQEANSQDTADSSSSNEVSSEKKAVKTSEKKAVKA